MVPQLHEFGEELEAETGCAAESLAAHSGPGVRGRALRLLASSRGREASSRLRRGGMARRRRQWH
eukprot:524495-Pleurochrysis_carterae.AAC.8